MEFKVGDRVRCIGNTTHDGGACDLKEGTIYEIKNGLFYLTDDGIDHFACPKTQDQIIKIGEPMLKYNELKSRIEALKNGWDKEADDVLQELNTETYGISIIAHNDEKHGPMNMLRCVEIQTTPRDMVRQFEYASQCEKMAAFKKALLWLLDHSNIKKDLVGQEVNTDIEGKIYKVKVLSEV